MEGVSGIAVLTRISTMALIKAKVMQHEVFFVGPQVSPSPSPWLEVLGLYAHDVIHLERVEPA